MGRHKLTKKIQEAPQQIIQTQTVNPFQLLRLKQVLNLVPVARSTWLQWVADGKAPRPVHLTPHCVAWKQSDIAEFIQRLGV